MNFTQADTMASIEFNEFKIDIEVQNIDGIFSRIFDHIPISKGFWVLLTISNRQAERERFPMMDEHYRVKTYRSYEEAIDDVSRLLKNLFRKAL